MPTVNALGRYLLNVLDPAMAVAWRVAVKDAAGVLKDRDGGRVARLAEVEADDPAGLSWQKDRRDGHHQVVAHCHSGTTASVNAASTMATGKDGFVGIEPRKPVFFIKPLLTELAQFLFQKLGANSRAHRRRHLDPVPVRAAGGPVLVKFPARTRRRRQANELAAVLAGRQHRPQAGP